MHAPNELEPQTNYPTTSLLSLSLTWILILAVLREAVTVAHVAQPAAVAVDIEA